MERFIDRRRRQPLPNRMAWRSPRRHPWKPGNRPQLRGVQLPGKPVRHRPLQLRSQWPEAPVLRVRTTINPKPQPVSHRGWQDDCRAGPGREAKPPANCRAGGGGGSCDRGAWRQNCGTQGVRAMTLSKLAGVPTLRAGLIDALGQIGGPQATDVSLQVLQNPENPLEVARSLRHVIWRHRHPANTPSKNWMLPVKLSPRLPPEKSPDCGPGPSFPGAPGLWQHVSRSGPGKSGADTELLCNHGSRGAAQRSRDPVPRSIWRRVGMPSDPNQYNKLPLQMLAQLSPQFPAARRCLAEHGLDRTRFQTAHGALWQPA